MITIIQDTREKTPWDFTFYGLDTKVKTLKTGDYTVEGYEDQIFIERKKSTGELAMNLGKKSKQFFAELERAKGMRHKYIVCEFPEENLACFPEKSGIPQKLISKVRMSTNFILLSLSKIRNQYGVNIIFANNPTDAEHAVINIINNIITK